MITIVKKPSIFALFFSISAIWYHNINIQVTPEDIDYIDIYLKGIDKNKAASKLSYEEQLELIRIVQSNVLTISPKGDGIPFYQERRPKNLYEFGEGLCFDRSFVMELIFQHLGFKTRHVSLFEDKPEVSTLSELTTKRIKSHAISEIKTKKGWLIIDSNNEWLGIDSNNLPISMKKINRAVSKIKWQSPPPTFFYTDKPHFIYGLYSRHGKFYKPYNAIPDYNFRGLLYNL